MALTLAVPVALKQKINLCHNSHRGEQLCSL